MTNATVPAAAASVQSSSAQTPAVAAPSPLGRSQSHHERERDVTRQGFENQEERGGGEADLHYVDHAYMHKMASEHPDAQNEPSTSDVSSRARNYKHST
ncbi:unnamed protein product [Peniophora sp. CBMAI 1063]|nr:unnamed protein product [Peniophora sp. CBMAI 1063]